MLYIILFRISLSAACSVVSSLAAVHLFISLRYFHKDRAPRTISTAVLYFEKCAAGMGCISRSAKMNRAKPSSLSALAVFSCQRLKGMDWRGKGTSSAENAQLTSPSADVEMTPQQSGRVWISLGDSETELQAAAMAALHAPTTGMPFSNLGKAVTRNTRRRSSNPASNISIAKDENPQLRNPSWWSLV